jgi:hypothetical protein
MNVLNNQHKLQRLKARYSYPSHYSDCAKRFTKKFKVDSNPLPMNQQLKISIKSFLLVPLLKASLECTKNGLISDAWNVIGQQYKAFFQEFVKFITVS